MQFFNAIAACSILVGALKIIECLSGQTRGVESLIIGVGCLGFGVLLSAIANVGMKLNRIEKRLERSSDDSSCGPELALTEQAQADEKGTSL